MKNVPRFNAQAFLLSFGVFYFVTVSAAGAATITYTYDALGRIVSETYDTGISITYSYDAAGNRAQVVTTPATAQLVWTTTSTPCATNCWGGAHW